MTPLGGWLRLPWRGAARRDDPYWDFFINTPPADPANLLRDVIRNAPEGNVFPTRADLHTPDVTTSHVKELARYLGADLVGVTTLDGDEAGHPYAIVCAVRADNDPAQARGIGGQVPVQNGLFVTFVLSAWIRELGFRATTAPLDGGLGTAPPDGAPVRAGAPPDGAGASTPPDRARVSTPPDRVRTSAEVPPDGVSTRTAPLPDRIRLAVAAKLGTLDRSGTLVTAEFGTRVHVADVIRTDLPLAPA